MKVDDDEVQKNKRLEKKRRLKERFDAEYDDGDATYFDDLKEEMQKQAEVESSTASPSLHSNIVIDTYIYIFFFYIL